MATISGKTYDTFHYVDGDVMPIHDWTKVNAGTFHDFHQTWIIEIKRALNAGGLPDGFYAMAEQIAGGWGPDVLTLEGPESENGSDAGDDWSSTGHSAVAVADRPPKVAHHTRAEVDLYALKASAITIRHSSGHRVVAMIEIVSPGNKNTVHGLSRFVEKANEVLEKGVHLLVVDLHPPGAGDPNGIHAAIWEKYRDERDKPFIPEAGKPLTLASYIGAEGFEAYVEPTAVGSALIDMPLFIDSDSYVPTPLEKTYQSAWEAVPMVWRKVLEGKGQPR